MILELLMQNVVKQAPLHISLAYPLVSFISGF
jgi:hypothetical protein